MKMSNEAKVGLVVIAALLMLAGLTIKTGNFKFQNKGYMIRVHFENIDGVATNSPVMFNGFEVGRVKTVKVKDAPEGVKMELEIWMEESVRVHEGAKAYVKNMGFMGEKYVSITAGDASLGYLAPGGLIVGKEPADLNMILSDGQAIAQDVKSITANLNERLEKNKEAIDKILYNLEQTTANVASLSFNLNESLTSNQENINEIMANLRSASVSFDLFAYDVMRDPWKLLYRTKEQRFKNLEDSEKSLRQTEYNK